MTPTTSDYEHLLSRRVTGIDVSGIRRVFELGASLENPINLSIGQPDFPVPDPIKDAAIEAIRGDRNGYTLTQGAADLREVVAARLHEDVGWTAPGPEHGLLITSGTSGALMLAFLALLDPDDEAIIADPYFVIYPALGRIAGARTVLCDTYPDFRMTAERVEPLITPRTKLVLVNSPGNPSGIVLSGAELRDLAALCADRGVMLISDEIYDEFTYADAREDGCFPSPARYDDRILLVRGFGKTYGCTGWRMGYAAGPAPIITEMAKLQQYTFVCAPSPAQAGCVAAFGVRMDEHVANYQRKRDLVCEALSRHAKVVAPGGAFYVFVEVPPRLGLTGTQFVERAIEKNVLVIPGGVFSARDTHFRISYAADDDKLAAGMDILAGMLSA